MLGQFLQHRGPRVLDLVDAMAQAHDLLLAWRPHASSHGRALPIEPISSSMSQHFLVGTAVQRAGQRADGRADDRVGVGQRRAGDAAAERRGVHGVLGVQDQAGVEHLAAWPATARARTASSRNWRRGRGRRAASMGSSPLRRRWKAATMVGSLAISRTTESQLLVALPTSRDGIEHAHGGHACLQGVHRVARLGQALDQVLELVLDAAVMAQADRRSRPARAASAGRP